MRKTEPGDLRVTCPLCKATQGLLCKSTGGHGKMAGVVHRERRIQAIKEGKHGV